MNRCVWIQADGERCGVPTRWKIDHDDDVEPYRKYDHLCPEHREESDRIDAITEQLAEGVRVRLRAFESEPEQLAEVCYVGDLEENGVIQVWVDEPVDENDDGLREISTDQIMEIVK